MIDKKHFLDNCSREFVPYKGFCKILEDGSYVEDENTSEPNGPFKIICDPISHGNWHTLYNLFKFRKFLNLPFLVYKSV